MARAWSTEQATATIWWWLPVPRRVPEPLDRGVHDRDVAPLGERDPAGEPVPVLEPKHLLQGVGVLAAPVGEHQLGGGDVRRLDVLDVPAAHGLGDRVAVDDL